MNPFGTVIRRLNLALLKAADVGVCAHYDDAADCVHVAATRNVHEDNSTICTREALNSLGFREASPDRFTMGFDQWLEILNAEYDGVFSPYDLRRQYCLPAPRPWRAADSSPN